MVPVYNFYGRLGYNYKVVVHGNFPAFVVEGEIDALSIEELGFSAVGLGPINNVDKFIDLCRNDPPTCPFLILLLDNDSNGKKFANQLSRSNGPTNIKKILICIVEGLQAAV